MFLSSVRTIYEFCCKGRDLNIWYEIQQTPNDNEISGIDELAAIITDYIIKHIKEEVLKVKLRKESFFKQKTNLIRFIFILDMFSTQQTPPETDEDCLLYYSSEWKNYRLSATMLNSVCAYFNSRMLKLKAYTVEQTAFDTWREHMFNHLNEKVSNAAIEMLERNRNGEIINTYAIKDVIQSYIDLGSLQPKDSKDSKKDPKDFMESKELEDSKESNDLKVMLCGSINEFTINSIFLLFTQSPL